MPTTAQLLKVFGHLPNVTCGDIHNVGLKADSFNAAEVLEDRQCGHPDVYDQEIADSDPDSLASTLDLDVNQCTGLIEAHRRMGPSAEASVGWPRNCNLQFPNSSSVTYFLDRATFPSHYTRPVRAEELDQIVEADVWRWTKEEIFDLWDGKPMLTVAYDLVNEAYRLVGCAQIEMNDGPDGKHNVHIKSVNIPGSTIGIAWFPDGTCSDHVNQHIDSSYRPGLMGTAKLGCHEFGHNHGLQHQFSGQNTHKSVMSYSPPRLFYGFSTGKAPYPIPRDRSLDTLIRNYGGKPNPPIDDTKPKPTNPEPPSSSPAGLLVIDGRTRRVWLED